MLRGKFNLRAQDPLFDVMSSECLKLTRFIQGTPIIGDFDIRDYKRSVEDLRGIVSFIRLRGVNLEIVDPYDCQKHQIILNLEVELQTLVPSITAIESVVNPATESEECTDSRTMKNNIPTPYIIHDSTIKSCTEPPPWLDMVVYMG